MRLFTLFSLVASATASPLLGDGLTFRKSVEGRAVTVSAADLENFKFFAQYAGSAYCNEDAATGSLVTCTANVCPTVMSDKAIVQTSLNGDTATNIDGYIGIDPARSLIVVAFRGSASIRNFIADIIFAQVPCDLTAGCLVHSGFWAAWLEVKASVIAAVTAAKAAHPSYTVVVSGHSLGGAVGTIAAAYLRKAGFPCDIYTFGSPRVGNDAFTSFVTTQAGAEYRVTHLDDPVPKLPPIILNYRHTSPEYWLSDMTATSTNYGVSDIKVCEGSANTNCNAGTGGFDIDAHKYYFVAISGCGDGLDFRRRDNVTDEELEQRLNMYASLDQGYASQLG